MGLWQDSFLLQLALGECLLLISAGSKAGQVIKLESQLRGGSTILMATSSR